VVVYGPFLFAADACFPRGGDRASSCLRGLASPPIPLESSAFRFNALFGSGYGIGGGGLHHDILLIVLRMVLSVPILSKGAVGRGPFLFAAGACFPRGGRRASSCLGGLASPSIPLESIVFQFTLLVLNLGVEGEWISSSCLCIGEGAAFLV